MTLPEFLLARIAEDEATLATASAAPEKCEWGALRAVQPHVAAYTAQFNGPRLLAECEAKRRIVGRHDVVDVTGGCAFCGEPAPCEHLRFLALPYADHPDYRDDWKP